MTTDEDTQPMTLPDIDVVPDDWPTERLPRTRSGARHTTPRPAHRVRSAVVWGAFSLLCAGALGGGVWFSTTANAGLATPASSVAPNPTVSSQTPGLVVIPTATATSSAPHTDARKAAVVAAPQDTTTPTAQSTPTDTPTPSESMSTMPGGPTYAVEPTPTQPTTVSSTESATSSTPTPVSTSPVANDPGCVDVTYSDGSVDLICSASGSPAA